MKNKIFAILALPPPPSRRKAYEYAERIRDRLPHRLRELRLALGLTAYALASIAGVSRDMIGDIEHGDSIPTLFLASKLAYGMGLTLHQFLGPLEDA